MRSLVKFLVVAAFAVLLASPFLPDVIHIPQGWLPRLPRLEVARSGMVGGQEPATEAAAQPDTAAIQVPAVAVEPAPRRAHVVRRHTRRVARNAAHELPLEDPPAEESSFEREHTATLVPVRVFTEVRLSSPASGAPSAPASSGAREVTPSASEARSGDRWPLLCGEVVDASGAAIEDARVRLDANSLVERTDRRGRFCLACPVNRLTLTVEAEGHGTVTYAVELDGATTQVRITLPLSH